MKLVQSHKLSSFPLFECSRTVGLFFHTSDGRQSNSLFAVFLAINGLLVGFNAVCVLRYAVLSRTPSLYETIFFTVFIVCHAVQMKLKKTTLERLFSISILVGRNDSSATRIFYAHLFLSATKIPIVVLKSLAPFFYVNLIIMELFIKLVLLQFCTSLHALRSEFTSLKFLKRDRAVKINIHSKLLEKAKAINDAYHVQLLASTAYMFLFSIAPLYHLIKSVLIKKFDVSLSLYKLITVIGHSLSMIYCCYSCEATVRSADNFNWELFHEIRRADALREQKTVLMHVRRMPTVKFTAFRLFTFGYPFLISLASGTVTYLAVAIQMSAYGGQQKS